jgi:catalase
MPLPSDPELITVSEDLIAQFDTLFGLHPGFRPAHARGVLLNGVFSPTAAAAKLSCAPHLNQPSTPISVRFSSSTGLPDLPDTSPDANPRGCAVRFHLGPRKHTDIIAHSTQGFPTRTGAEFLEFLRAVAASAQSTASPTPIQQFLGTHPAALAFVKTPKPSPSSFAREAYFGLNALAFVNDEGASRFGRYTLVPVAGIDHLGPAALESKGPNYLFEELPERIANHGPVEFDLHVQLAEDGDVTDDVTVQWPVDRPVVNLGKLTLTTVAPDSLHEQQRIIFDPIPRVKGIEPSKDPLLELRAAVYLISGRRRRPATLEA